MIKITNLIVFLRDKKWQLLPPVGTLYRYHSRFAPPEQLTPTFYLRPKITEAEFADTKVGGADMKDTSYAKILLDNLHSIYASTYSKKQLRRILSASSQEQYNMAVLHTIL